MAIVIAQQRDLVPYQTKTFESAPFTGQGSLPAIAQIGDCVEQDEDIHTLQNHAVNLSCKLEKKTVLLPFE